MLKFEVVSAGCDVLNDTDRSTTFRSKSRAPQLQKSTKSEGPSENIISPNNRLIISDQNSKLSSFTSENETQEPQK